MSNGKTEILDREQLKSQISDRSIKHLWLANQVGVSEKTLTRWVNGDVTRIRTNNLNRLADSLGCHRDDLIASSETDVYPSDKNRNVLINELNNDNLLYELLVSSKIKLAISLIKSTFHSALPNGVIANFYIKLGYASLIHRKLKTAHKYFSKALSKAESIDNDQLIFSANLGLALNYFFNCDYQQCYQYLVNCQQKIEFSGQEKAHYYNTFAMHSLYTGNLDECIKISNECIKECAPSTKSIEKKLFHSSALQLSGASHLIKGHLRQAEACCVESVTIAEQSGYKRSIAVSKAYLAAVLAQTDRCDSANELIKESIELVGEKDISLPSLLCIATYVSRISGDTVSALIYSNRISAITSSTSSPMAFIHLQEYLQKLDQDNQDDAKKNLTELKKVLADLKLDLWMEWLEKAH